jgi:hypothetical protein
MSNSKIIKRIAMDGKTKYSYCPHCVKKQEEAGKSWEELPPLFKLIMVTYDPEVKREIPETKYECPKCHQVSDLETFIKFYTK